MNKKFLQKIFKKLSYFIFFLIYGRIEKSIKSNSDARISVDFLKINNNYNYKIYKVHSGRLYTDRIHDTAIILDNKIIEGPSFQLRENNNSKISNNIVFAKGTPRVKRNLKGTVASLLTGGGGNSNYWHWLYDVLPRLKLCEKVQKLDHIDYFIFPSLKKRFQIETLKALNLNSKKILTSEKYRHFKTNELIVTDHPYIFTNDSHADVQQVPEWIIQWLKDKFLAKPNTENTKYPKNIFLDRSDSSSNVSHYRSLINEEEIKNYLIRENFTLVRLNELKFTDQVQYFNNAEQIIGLHGAGFANLSFCKKNTKIIEFRTDTTGKMYENLAKTNQLKFNSIICKAESYSLGKQLGHIKIPITKLKEKMNDF